MLLPRTITVTTRPSPTSLPNSGTGTELSKYFFIHNKVFSPSLRQCSGELIRERGHPEECPRKQNKQTVLPTHTWKGKANRLTTKEVHIYSIT